MPAADFISKSRPADESRRSAPATGWSFAPAGNIPLLRFKIASTKGK